MIIKNKAIFERFKAIVEAPTRMGQVRFVQLDYNITSKYILHKTELNFL